MREIHGEQSLEYPMQSFVFVSWQPRGPDSFPTNQRFSNVQPHPLIATDAADHDTPFRVRHYVIYEGPENCRRTASSTAASPRYSTYMSLSKAQAQRLDRLLLYSSSFQKRDVSRLYCK